VEARLGFLGCFLDERHELLLIQVSGAVQEILDALVVLPAGQGEPFDLLLQALELVGEALSWGLLSGERDNGEEDQEPEHGKAAGHGFSLFSAPFTRSPGIICN